MSPSRLCSLTIILPMVSLILLAKGDYDFVEAVKAGRLNYRGDLSKAVRLAGILKSDAKLEIATEKSSD